MPRGSGRHCFTVDRGGHRGDCRFFYSLDLRLSRERGRASARQIKLLSIFSLEYIYLLYFLFLMLLLVACWTSVGCLLFGVLNGCSGVLLTCIFIGTYECYF